MKSTVAFQMVVVQVRGCLLLYILLFLESSSYYSRKECDTPYYDSSVVRTLKPGLHQNTIVAFENDANIRCKRVTEARQTAFGCATNVRRTAECYPLTVSTSKGIRVQYVYVGSIRCFGECRTIYKFTHINVRIVFVCRIRVHILMQTRLNTKQNNACNNKVSLSGWLSLWLI